MPATIATQLADALLAQLDREFEPMGFKRRKRDYLYRRDTGPVRHYIHLTIAKDPGLAQVAMDVGVRIHAIEEAIGPYPGSSKRWQDRATVGVELGNWTGAGWRSWSLAKPDDVEAVSRAIVSTFLKAGQPFLERFSSVAEIRDVLRKDGEEARLVCLRERRDEILNASARLAGTA